MSEPEAPDMALATLLQVAHEANPAVAEELVRKAYLIQRRHQFDRDPEVSYQEMKRLVTEFVQAAPTIEAAGGGQ